MCLWFVVDCPLKRRQAPRAVLVETLPVCRRWVAGLSFFTLHYNMRFWILFCFHVNSYRLRRKWNESEKIKSSRMRQRMSAAVLRSEATCSISKHDNHKFTNLSHMPHQHVALIGNGDTLTIVSLLLMADPVHLAMTLSMHFLWMAALHSEKHKDDTVRNEEEKVRDLNPPWCRWKLMRHSRLHW